MCTMLHRRMYGRPIPYGVVRTSTDGRMVSEHSFFFCSGHGPPRGSNSRRFLTAWPYGYCKTSHQPQFSYFPFFSWSSPQPLLPICHCARPSGCARTRVEVVCSSSSPMRVSGPSQAARRWDGNSPLPAPIKGTAPHIVSNLQIETRHTTTTNMVVPK